MFSVFSVSEPHETSLRHDKPRFMALFEDNDPKKRMLCIANYQNDLSEFWEFSEEGRYLVQDSNEAYKVGVNQFIYGITH